MASYSHVIAGLALFASKQAPEAQVLGADHDVIYGAPSRLELTQEEIDKLGEWGWFLSDEYDCWCAFV
jgi:hypothetical protein